MNKNIFILIVLFIVTCFTSVSAQNVNVLRSSYTGSTTWDNASAILTFTSTGTIKAAAQNSWKIPQEVKKVVIAANVTVTGRFDCEFAVIIEGKDRCTSVLFGTNQQEYASANGGGDKLSAVRVEGNTKPKVTIRNFTSLNPKGFHFTARNKSGLFTIQNCNLIDDRGGCCNNSDGIVTWGGGYVSNCYFETGDDIIKVYGDITVEDSHIEMVENTVPIQLGWGDYGNGAKGIFKNLKITGNSGRGASGNGVINARRGTYNKTITINGLDLNNSNASLFSFREGQGKFDIYINNAKINVKRFQNDFNNQVSGSIKICGTSYNRNTTKTSWNCLSNAIADVEICDNGTEGNTCGDSPNGKVVITKTNQNCNKSGAVTLAVNDYGGRTNIKYSIADGELSTNISTDDEYVVTDLEPGSYDVYAEWGNGDCAKTKVGSFEIIDQCAPNDKEGPYFIQSPDSGRRLFGGSTQLQHSSNGSSGDFVQWYKINAGNEGYYLQLKGNNKFIQKIGDQLYLTMDKTLATRFFTTTVNAEGFAHIRALQTNQNIRRNNTDGQNNNTSCATVNSTGVLTLWKFVKITNDKESASVIESRIGVNTFSFTNPVSDILRLGGINKSDQIKIYNISGRKIIGLTGKSIIDTSSLEEGIYILVINNTIEKFIKTKH